jgi:hypothetical protein
LAATDNLLGNASPGPSPTEGNGATGPKPGRGERGRFAPGNRFAKGNPHARRVAALRKAFLDAATEDRMRRLADKLLKMAEAGDVTAARLALEYTLGKPAPAADIDRLGLDEVSMLLEAPKVMSLFRELCDRLPTEVLANVARMIAANRLAAYRHDGEAADADALGVMLAASLDGGEGHGAGGLRHDAARVG